MGALALATLNGARCFELYLGSNAEHALKFRGQFLLQGIDSSGRIEGRSEHLLTQLSLYKQGVEALLTIYDEHVAWSELRQRQDDTLHL